MIAAARILPLRQRGQRLPRRHPTTLRSVETREASGAPAPAAPPPSSAGAPPAASAPPAAAPPPPPVPESGERVRPTIEPIVLLQGQLLAIVRSFTKPAELTGGAAEVWALLDMIVKLISLHIAQPHHPLKFDTIERPEGALVSLLLDTREEGDEADQEEKRPEQLPEELAFVASTLSWALGDFAGAQESAQRIQRTLASPTGLNARLLTSEMEGLVACLNSLSDELRQIAGRLGGLDDGASLATHAARLGRLAGYSDTGEMRRLVVAESLDAWSE